MNVYKAIMKRVTDQYPRYSLFRILSEECSDDEWIDYIKGGKDNPIYMLFCDVEEPEYV